MADYIDRQTAIAALRKFVEDCKGSTEAKGSWQRHRINRQAAKRLMDAFGVDITMGG